MVLSLGAERGVLLEREVLLQLTERGVVLLFESERSVTAMWLDVCLPDLHEHLHRRGLLAVQ